MLGIEKFTKILKLRNQSGKIKKNPHKFHKPNNIERDIKIYVFHHKAADVPFSPLFQSKGVGEASPKTEKNSINHLNKYFCELTGIYEIWKNHSWDIVGTAHYRRYLNLIPLSDPAKQGKIKLTKSQAFALLKDPDQGTLAKAILEQYPIIVPRANYQNPSLGAVYDHPGWETFRFFLDKKYGRYNHCLDFDKRGFWGNIFIMRHDIFDTYCSELFPIIFSCFKEIGIIKKSEKYRYCPSRYPGYLAERFLTAFINAHQLRYYEADLIEIKGS